MMYFPGLCKDKVLFHRDFGLNSEPKRVESHEETAKEKPANMVTLFGRQVCPIRSQSCGSPDGQLRRNLKLPMRGMDLRLPADQYIYNLHESAELRNFCSHGCSQDMVQLELSLGLETRAKEASMTNWLGKRHPETVINLEEPPTWFSRKETEPTASVSSIAPASCLGRRLGPQVSVLSDHTTSKILKADQSPVDDDRCCQKQEFSDKGYRSCNSEKTIDNKLFSKHQFISCGPRILDLNEIPIDDPGRDLEHCFLQDLNCPYTEDTQVSCEKSDVEDPTPFCSPRSQNVHENVREKDGTTSPASYTSCSIIDNPRIESRSSSPRTVGPSCRTRLEYPGTEALPGEPKDGCCDEEDSCEMDPSVQMAAESLVHISFDRSSQNQDFPSKPEPGSNSLSQYQDFSSRPELGNAEPACSCDSYELLTLELAETGPDYHSASSKALDELNIMDNSRDFGFKLRRGRRMKNFQKEILPGLVSLSRHEIREDINILEAVLRSREYKKMQGKTGEGSRWGANPRNRRSGQRYVGRRRRRSE